ncbi:hypothetical protein [Leptolyngbya sp. FACHB-261]|uniref:hypothetical protein n=1 Tax=Leptolyngbya sp. FACHB-261 TaxID=2692806 RepID=UPI001683B951|nr:hypothetical protein [Leptolyngbya sp. FACHB-261]MBD2103656.1 hypothetical protein [Leptolyngbya sp. FACHB-261]
MTEQLSEKYQQILNPWAITRRSPNSVCSTVIARFRRRTDAEGHLQALRRTVPSLDFEVVWDAIEDRP